MITTGRMAAVDRNAEALGVPRKQLMESSGNAVARLVEEVAEEGDEIAVVAGRGNNGGDAFAAVRFLEGYRTTVHLLGRPDNITTNIARENWDALRRGEYDTVEVRDSRDLDLGDPDVVVDAMLGTGITGDLREPAATAADEINASDAVVVAVDVPSGLDADSGEAAPNAVEADYVVTFHDAKPGLADGDAEVRVADIGIPAAAERFLGPGDMRPVRDGPSAQRGGRVYVVGGGPYTGAPALSAQASLRAGADLSFVAVPESIEGVVAGYAEDLIVQAYEGDHLTPGKVDDIVDTAERYDDVVVIGPGLGSDDETLEAAREFLREYTGPAVVDADALPAVPEVETEATLVCTPNRKELAGMGGPETDNLRDRLGDVESFAAGLGHVVIAKGRDDVVSDGEETRVCRAGTPGMTVGGTGDVLAGVTAGLLGTHDPFDAACMATYANGRAAELHGHGDGGLLASDLLDRIPDAIWGRTRGSDDE